MSGRVRDEQRVLRLPVAVVDRQPERVLEALDHLGVERLARRDGVAEPRQVASSASASSFASMPVLRRRLAEHRDAELRQEREALLRARTAPSWTTTSAPSDHGPRRTFQIAFAQPVPAVHQTTSCSWASSQWLACIALRPRVGVGVDDALRLLRRPRGVEDERGLAGRRLLGRRARARSAGARPGPRRGRGRRRCPRPGSASPRPRPRTSGRRRRAARRSGGRGTRGRARGACPGTGRRRARP